MDNNETSRKTNLFCCFTKCCFWKKRTMSRAEINRSHWSNFGYKTRSLNLPPIFELLIALYNEKDVVEGLESCRINPDFTPDPHLRNDLEYYIPQLTNFMVFHQDIFCNKLSTFLEEVSKADPYFAHSYHWYITSLVPAITVQKTQAILNEIIKKCSEGRQTQVFVTEYENFFIATQKKLAPEDYEADFKELQSRRFQAEKMIEKYKDNEPISVDMSFQLRAIDLELKPYRPNSPQTEDSQMPICPFTSTLSFFNDLSVLGEEVTKSTNRLVFLQSALGNINRSLPACVYVPFVKDTIRHYAILNIVIPETKVFSTKERAPFYLCMELYKPKEELAYDYNEIFELQERKQEKKKNLIEWAKKNLNFTKLLPIGSSNNIEEKKSEEDDSKELDDQFRISKIKAALSNAKTLKIHRFQEEANSQNDLSLVDGNKKLGGESFYKDSFDGMRNEESTKTSGNIPRKASLPVPSGRFRKLSTDNFRKLLPPELTENTLTVPVYASKRQRSQSSLRPCTIPDKDTSRDGIKINVDLNEPLYLRSEDSILVPLDKDQSVSRALSQEEVVDIFGEDTRDQNKRIRENSPFKHLKSWKLVHVIVKKGADIKEEQFATQLISQFDQIFRVEKVKLKLTPYEIVSLGSDFGIVEMVKDSITISRLKEKMYSQGIPTLNEFFIKYYGSQVEHARRNFCRSLAAYSLVCYFLQIKDRHNGNIMFHKDGHILHIDFGFFLSNSPGKGIEFERKVPFKLMHEDIEVLGGTRSSLFQYFRRLFYQGFMAARKHREQILILVKMMYSGQGSNLPCFKGGIKSITDLEQRFCPPGVSENDLRDYCYNLINQSLDNWRAKCYDKYQYHFQGIFY